MTKRSKNFFGENIYYHIFNRGVEKRNIFIDEHDYNRFVLLLLLMQGDVYFNNIGRLASLFDEHQMLNIKDIKKDIVAMRIIELVSFVLMPNHFHCVVREIKDGGIAKFTQRLCNSYAKYFNLKYKRNGHLFGSKYHRKLIDTNEYLLHLSAYIHRNPRELKKWTNKEEKYPWSSYQDYIIRNRWEELLSPSIILDQFQNKQEYKHFIRTSPAKDIENNMFNI